MYFIFFMGIKFCLLFFRKEDVFNEGFLKWFFMIMYLWGEDFRGIWILEIKDFGDNRLNYGIFIEW